MAVNNLDAVVALAPVRPADLKVVPAVAAGVPAKTGDLDITLKPGQTANIGFEEKPQAGGPQAPETTLMLIEQLKKALATISELIAKFFPAKPAAGGPAAPATPPAGGPAAATTPVAPPAPETKPKGNNKKKGRKAIDAAKMDALEAQFGKWSGKGKNTDPRSSTGPKGGALIESAYSKLQSGDTSGAKSDYEKAKKTSSPIMFDLNNDGKLGTTGVSTAKDRKPLGIWGPGKSGTQEGIQDEVGRTVDFDIDGNGTKDKIEWSDGLGDGFLVDDRDGGATKAANGNGEIDGKRLFGDQGGKFASGYDKLKALDTDGDGVLRGKDLAGLKMWVDNGDARVGGGELKSLADLGITEISVGHRLQKNARGEDLMHSAYVQNGKSRLSEDVWFAKG